MIKTIAAILSGLFFLSLFGYAYAAPGDVKLECPISTTPVVDGQTVVCVYKVEPPASTSTVPTTTTTSSTVTPTTTTVPPTTTTTTPPPQPVVLKGWSLTYENTGLAAQGLTCDGLAAYTGSLKPAAGTTISNRRITGPLDLSNGNILIEKSCIRPQSTGYHNAFLVTTTICSGNNCWATPTGNVRIHDSDIDASRLSASAISKSCAFLGVGELKRNRMHSMGSGICFFETGNVHNALAENNYVYGLRSYGDSHNEAATIRDFVKNSANTRTVKFINNRLDCSSGNATGGLFIQPTWLDIYNGLIQGNYLEGEGYNLYLENKDGIYGNMRAIDNRFRPTGWGPHANPSGFGWAVWTDNYRYDSTKPDGKGAVVFP